MKFKKTILCGILTWLVSFVQITHLPINTTVLANTESEMVVELGRKYNYQNDEQVYNVTNGEHVSSKLKYDFNIALYDHVSNTSNVSSAFSDIKNENVFLDDALFKFTAVENTEDQFIIYNKFTDKYLTNETSADSFFNQNKINMKVTPGTEEENTFLIRKSDDKRYIIFYNNELNFNSNTNFSANYGSGSYHLLLLKEKESYDRNDVIPGYEQVSSIESGESYLIAYKNNSGVFLLYPTNGKDNQSKIVKYTNKYSDLYEIGSSTVSSDTLEDFHLKLTKSDNGVTMQASNNEYMINIGAGSAILSTTETFFVYENGAKAGTYRIKINGGSYNGRYFVFNNTGPKLDAMGSYSGSWDKTSGDYDFMFFEKTDNLDLNALIPGYAHVSDITNISDEKSYIIVYNKESGNDKGIYVVNPFGNVARNNSLRKVKNMTKQLEFSFSEVGRKTATVNGIVLNFHVVKNLALGKSVDIFWSDNSSQDAKSGVGNATNGTIHTNDYLEFGRDNDTRGSYIQIDLGHISLIRKINLYRFWNDGRKYRNTVIAISNDKDFHNFKTLFNSDANNIHGMGAGKDVAYSESSSGKTFNIEPINARYVRVYNNGQDDSHTTNHIVELQVFGFEESPAEITTSSIMNTKDVTYVGDFIFEGYYSDESGSNPFTKKEYLENSEGLAKYVNPKVLTVKAQSELVDGNANVRFVSSVASANLEKVRFKIEVVSDSGTKTGNVYTKKVYERIVANEGAEVIFKEPQSVFENDASKYFFVAKLNNIPSTASAQTVNVTPYWLPFGAEDKEGNYIKGATRSFKVQDFFDKANK